MPGELSKHTQRLLENKKSGTLEHGCRHFDLDYYDCIRMLTIDPNLYLGTAKHAMKTWTECNIIPASRLQEIQARVDAIQVPSFIGRIPCKIQSSFSGFTADQWRNWVCVYLLLYYY